MKVTWLFVLLILFIGNSLAQEPSSSASRLAHPKAVCLPVNGDFHRGNPGQSAALLAAELNVVKRGRYRSGEHPYTVWCIRALRRISGQDFRGPTASKLSDDEKNFLRPDERGRILFFGTWMSRDSVFVAPVDAQREIIKQWREWFAKEGKTHKYIYDDSNEPYF